MEILQCCEWIDVYCGRLECLDVSMLLPVFCSDGGVHVLWVESAYIVILYSSLEHTPAGPSLPIISCCPGHAMQCNNIPHTRLPSITTSSWHPAVLHAGTTMVPTPRHVPPSYTLHCTTLLPVCIYLQLEREPFMICHTHGFPHAYILTSTNSPYVPDTHGLRSSSLKHYSSTHFRR